MVRKADGLRVVEPAVADAAPDDGWAVSRALPRGGVAQDNPLGIFSDSELLRMPAVEPDLVSWLRGIPPAIDFGEAVGDRVADAHAVAILADLWERPADLAAVFADGGRPTAADVRPAPDEPAARLRADDSRTELVAGATARQLQRLLDASIEDWMVYLHPSQRDTAQARFNGPARVRGGPGTGETVVAFHRGRWLARQDARTHPVLLTRFLRTLPPVWDT